jgi:Asp-tRNA(Asn)/Glu-tRNA(Gln) amidotransferase A subunit family amidase
LTGIIIWQKSNMSELYYQDLLTIVRRIQSREISSEEVSRALLNRIEYLDSTLHSYFIVMKESALAEARIADKEIASGELREPLHGVPVAVKEVQSEIMTSNLSAMLLKEAVLTKLTPSSITSLKRGSSYAPA